MSSLVALALRICAVRALEGRTYAQDRVFDSALMPIDAIANDNPKPFIVITSGDEDANFDLRNVQTGTRTIDLFIESAVATPADDPDQGIVIARTDATLELTIALLTRQIMRRLFTTDAASPWPELFTRGITKIVKSVSRRGIPEDGGDAFAARQIGMTVNVLDEPAFGTAPTGWFADFLAACRMDADLTPIADLIESVIVGDPIPDWDQDFTQSGMLREAAQGVGIAAPDDPAAAPPLANDATVQDDSE